MGTRSKGVLNRTQLNPGIEIPIRWYQRQFISFPKLVDMLGLCEEAVAVELKHRGIDFHDAETFENEKFYAIVGEPSSEPTRNA